MIYIYIYWNIYIYIQHTVTYIYIYIYSLEYSGLVEYIHNAVFSVQNPLMIGTTNLSRLLNP